MQKIRVYYILADSGVHFGASDYAFLRGFSVFAKCVKSMKPRINACKVALKRALRPAKHAYNAAFGPPRAPTTPKLIEKHVFARKAFPTAFLQCFLRQCQNRRSPGLPQKRAPDYIFTSFIDKSQKTPRSTKAAPTTFLRVVLARRVESIHFTVSKLLGTRQRL